MIEQKHTFKRIFISWEPSCTRSENLAKHMGAKNIFIAPLHSSKKLILLRYLLSFLITLYVMVREKPDIVFTLNLPPFLILSVYLYSILFKSEYVLDSHSGAFSDRKWSWFYPCYKLISSKALLNINTNEHHKKLVESWNGKSIIVSDVPIIHDEEYPKFKAQSKSVAVVASYAYDEPIKEIWDAAELVPEINFYITGNPKKLARTFIDNKPSNITFTGFLSQKEYFGLLKAVDGVMVLTTRNHTMQRGAYEALSLGKPIITSDWPVLVETFGDSAVYVRNTARSISEGVNILFENLSEINKKAILQKKIRIEVFEKVKQEILNYTINIKPDLKSKTSDLC